jgi:2-methylcitrate dehydratase PrpD
MSIPYSVAVAIVAGRVGLNEFSRDWINSSEVKRIMNKIHILADPDLTAAAPQKRAAIAKITTNDGLDYAKKVNYPKGEPENPMSIDDLKSKFIGLAKHSGVCENRAYDIITTILGDGLAFLQLLQDL